MIQLATLSLQSTPLPGADLPTGLGDAAPAGPDFGAFLAASTGSTVSENIIAEMLPSAGTEIKSLKFQPEILPEGGKILPGSLPEAAKQDAPIEAQYLAKGLVQAMLATGSGARTHARAIDPSAAEPEAQTGDSTPAVLDDAPVQDGTPASAMIIPAIAAIAAPLPPVAAPTDFEASATAAAPARSVPMPPPPAPGTGPQQQPQRAKSISPLPVIPALASATDASPAVFAQYETPLSAPLPAQTPKDFTARVEIGTSPSSAPSSIPAPSAAPPSAAPTGLATAPQESTDLPVEPRPGPASDLPGSAVSAAPAPAFPAAMAVPDTTPTPAANRPHDFAGLVDSLVAAREAAQPRAVSVALAHAEFGQVNLRFKHDDGALSVTMNSADPDFARAASLAMASVPPPTASGAAASPGSGDQSAASFGQQAAPRQQGNATSRESEGQSQNHERPPQQHGERGAARSAVASKRDGLGGDAPARGIFA